MFAIGGSKFSVGTKFRIGPPSRISPRNRIAPGLSVGGNIRLVVGGGGLSK
jgi:hypothetical protein